MIEGAPRIAAVVLAAGRSTRMGAANKLLADIGGRAMVRRVAECALASSARPVVVVTGHMAAEVSGALAGLETTLVTNPDYASGLASSLRAGIGALPPSCAGAVVMLGDMPGIAPAHLERLIGAFAEEAVIVPVRGGKQGNPVLWPARYFPELIKLEGDAGAKRLLGTHASKVREVDLATDAIFADVDTPEALDELRARSSPVPGNH